MPEPEPVGATVAAPTRPAGVDALGVIPPEPMPEGTTLPPDPILDAPVFTAADVHRGEQARWPCVRCGATNALADDACTTCGAAFLPSEPLPDLNLPMVGNVRGLDRMQRALLTIGALGALCIAFVVAAYVVGSVL